jgi:phage terminase large subunit
LSILKIPTAKIFEPLLAPARYKAVHGGRGSGKSHFFGELLVEICQAERGTSAVCIREAQKTLAQSSKRLIERKIAGLGLRHQFKIFSDKIATPGDGVIIFRGMQMQGLDSIADALGDPNLKDQISAAIGDARTAGRILLGISVVTILVRLRSLKRGT